MMLTKIVTFASSLHAGIEEIRCRDREIPRFYLQKETKWHEGVDIIIMAWQLQKIVTKVDFLRLKRR